MSRPPRMNHDWGEAEAVPLHLPDPDRLFRRRAARFRELAPGHASGDYLAALSALADAQGIACRQVCLSSNLYPLSKTSPLSVKDWKRGGEWREALAVILSEMGKAVLPAPARATLARIEASAPGELEAAADALLAGDYERIDPAAAPFIGGAVQVYWTLQASQLAGREVERSETGCPVCGSPPVAAIVQGGVKLRYLVCSLCSTEWHLTRVMCATCHSIAGIGYFAVEGDSGAVKAEGCAECRTYLKLFYLEREPRAEPFADDVATLPLDLLMSDAGYARAGVNLFLLPRSSY